MNKANTYELIIKAYLSGTCSTHPAGHVKGTLSDAVKEATSIVKKNLLAREYTVIILSENKDVGEVNSFGVFKPNDRYIRQIQPKSARISAEIQHQSDVYAWEKMALEKKVLDVVANEKRVFTQLECDKSNNHRFVFTEDETTRYNRPDGWHGIKCSNCGFETYVDSDFDLKTLNSKK